MAIEGPCTGGACGPDPRRAEQSARGDRVNPGVDGVRQKTVRPLAPDVVELSPEARALATGVPRDTLAPERLREVAERIGSGYYDVPEVRTELSRRVAADL